MSVPSTALLIQSTICVFWVNWFNIHLSLLCFITTIRQFLEFALLGPDDDDDDDYDNDDDLLKKAITRTHHVEINSTLCALKY